MFILLKPDTRGALLPSKATVVCEVRSTFGQNKQQEDFEFTYTANARAAYCYSFS